MMKTLDRNQENNESKEEQRRFLSSNKVIIRCSSLDIAEDTLLRQLAALLIDDYLEN
ncbi:MAG: hypothetical protein RJA07_932 [Bacteroidota bacterium]|jgi:anti-anti-sigma regulatory factor